VGVTALVHPFEIMKVNAIIDPDAPLNLEPLKGYDRQGTTFLLSETYCNRD